ncbi:MAG: amidohydrolase [Bacteroidales bacterium]|nr:amidohydrolase [Bacteroidales bacterium]
MKTLESLRHKLFKYAELSGNEKETNKIINRFLEKTNPDIHLKNVGGYGIIAMYKGVEDGRNIMLRADIDGLNIPLMSTDNGQQATDVFELSAVSTKCQSSKLNVQSSKLNAQYSHRCGHDGHAAILCGLAMRLGKKRPAKGNVILLFQPAEETGEGAKAVINDPQFRDLKIDTAFALHNLPSYAKHQIVVKKDCFASASLGLKLIFDGKTSHASQPEKGNNPQIVVTTLLDAFHRKYENLKKDKHHTILTITRVVIGEETFGVTPGHAEIWMTLRSQDDKALQNLTESTIGLCEYISKEYRLNFSHSIHEDFAATMNSGYNTEIVRQAARDLKLSVNEIKEPFPWSEDFGRFGNICPICLFGLGCGLEHEPLHSPRYEFEDEIIDTGIDVFEKIIEIESNLS